MNHCIFMGNLTRDVEIRNVGNSKVANFSVAVSRTFKKQSGEIAKEVSYLDMEAWDSGADTIYKYFKKGDRIVVHCSVKQETWEDKTTKQQRSKLKFRVNQFYFPESKRREDSPEGVKENAGVSNTDGGAGEDIPF